MANRVVDEQLRRCEDRFLSHFWTVVFEIWQSSVADKLVQDVTWEVQL